MYQILLKIETLFQDIRCFGEGCPFNTLMLVDGKRTNQADLNGVNLTQITLERGKRIEIIRGAMSSVLSRDNAIGGVKI
ncbi:MAG: TonB-dependent receptor plug domain-containing protein [Thermodesulfovibrionales bacterium]|nr:TonB-dependent receptor plug domain-containing protein [Thermodesulfovibrionales bacterium]